MSNHGLADVEENQPADQDDRCDSEMWCLDPWQNLLPFARSRSDRHPDTEQQQASNGEQQRCCRPVSDLFNSAWDKGWIANDEPERLIEDHPDGSTRPHQDGGV